MIELKGLTKHYGQTVAVQDLTFTVRPGQVTGFLGPNGAGKSTTMRMILGLDKPTAGTALIQGRPYHELDHPLRIVGALLDAKWVHPNRSARAHLEWMAASNDIAKSRVDEVLRLVGLSEVAGKTAGGFSLGMSQRLGLAGALLGDPQVLLFDEPVNGLDPEGILWIRRFMQRLAAEGRTVLVSSHLLSEMAQTAEHLVVIGRGKLISDSTTQEFIERASEQSVRVRSPQLDELRSVLTSNGMTVREDGAGADGPALVVANVSSDAVGKLAGANDITLFELAPQRASLEEAFMRMTGGAVQYHGEGFDPAGATDPGVAARVTTQGTADPASYTAMGGAL
ncbi:ATP-binding cassette domain-containing protein [Nocardia sp. NBC_01730]|uniref:ABC transporter ATP-binding protein n=1 Tax=Nocardia sp. NBC_01730 TaxID=2975998 RepID=UPI002E0F91E8|nr:ATP-binding cassette domain-containing protein [Nocardia sp. NBC_01730]